MWWFSNSAGGNLAVNGFKKSSFRWKFHHLESSLEVFFHICYRKIFIWQKRDWLRISQTFFSNSSFVHVELNQIYIICFRFQSRISLTNNLRLIKLKSLHNYTSYIWLCVRKQGHCSHHVDDGILKGSHHFIFEKPYIGSLFATYTFEQKNWPVVPLSATTLVSRCLFWVRFPTYTEKEK